MKNIFVQLIGKIRKWEKWIVHSGYIVDSSFVYVLWKFLEVFKLGKLYNFRFVALYSFL